MNPSEAAAHARIDARIFDFPNRVNGARLAVVARGISESIRDSVTIVAYADVTIRDIDTDERLMSETMRLEEPLAHDEAGTWKELEGIFKPGNAILQ